MREIVSVKMKVFCKNAVLSLKKHNLSLLTLILLGLLTGCIFTSSTSSAAPIILSIQLLDEDGNQLFQDSSEWVSLPSECEIVVDYEGTVSKAEFYITPTGTETSDEKELIGTVDTITDSVSTITLDWQPPDSFMGYVSVILYNGQTTTLSEEKFFIKAYRE